MSRNFIRLLIAASVLGSVSAAFAAPILYQNPKYLIGSEDPIAQNPVRSTDPMSRESRYQIFVPSSDFPQAIVGNTGNRQGMLPN
jgi:hypothetical protein